MEKSLVSKLYNSFSEETSTDDEGLIASNNNVKNISASSDIKKAKQRRNSNLLQTIENKGSNNRLLSEERNNNFGEIHFAVEKERELIIPGSSNMSKNNLSNNMNKSNNNQTESNEDGDNDQGRNSIEHRRKSMTFSSKKKSKLRGTEDEGLDDSGVTLNDSTNQIYDTEQSDSVFLYERSALNPSELDVSNNQSTITSDEGEASEDNGSKNDRETADDDDQQVNKIEREWRIFTLKRKLSFPGTEIEEYTDSGEKPNKRGRGKYMLRDIPGGSSSSDLKKRKTGVKRRLIEPGKAGPSRSSDQVNDIEDIQTQYSDDKNKKKKGDERMTENESSRNQILHNNKILKLLNEGSPENIKSLYRVGIKTALIIHQYRKIKGKFNSIGDLKNMPAWSQKYFYQFLSANNLTID